MLRMHVLRIGLSKSQLKDTSAKELREANQKGGSFASRVTGLFTHRDVENAHRAVEDSKERIMQEMLFRRAKVEKRLEREEAEEKERLLKLKKLPKGAATRQTNSSGQQHLSTIPAYQSAFLAEQDEDKLSRQGSHGSRKLQKSSSERSIGRSDGEESDSTAPASPKAKGKSKARSKSNDGGSTKSSSPERSPSPKGKKSPAKEKGEKKAGTKEKSKGDREESSSPRKSPKAKSKKAAAA